MFDFQKLISNKWFIILGGTFILFILVLQFRQYQTKREVQKEIDNLSRQADQLQKNNQDLQSLVAYLKTDSYQEKTAREQLSLRKQGETVYSFSSAAGQTIQNPAAGDKLGFGEGNPKKWWNYFFKAN
ncbi:MAG: hypothetical protein NVSMB66_2500 [Candidatus Doudnabacteria bacterium]